MTPCKSIVWRLTSWMLLPAWAVFLGGQALRAETPAAPPQLERLVTGNTQFAVELYHQLRQQEGNQFFSPYSVSSALGMTYAGARGETEAEIYDALHFTLGQESLHPAFDQLYKLLTAASGEGGQRLNIANGLCLTGGDVSQDFKTLLQRYYNAELFRGDVEAINAWVAERTEGKIDKLIEELDPNSVCVLLNAIYFKGTWASQFEETRTREAPFHVTSEEQVESPLMYQKGNFRLFAGDGFQALSLPYQGEQSSMIVLLPNEIAGLAALEEQLASDALSTWLTELDRQRSREVEVYLPKFKLETSYDLVSPFRELGIEQAFEPDRANFTGMGWPEGELWISQIKHKAVVEVNEEGTEAAAATGVVAATRALPPRRLVFKADHPFLFLIRDNQTGTLLFLGRLVDPTAG